MLRRHLDELRRASASDPWAGKRYEWLKLLAPVEIGAVGAELYVRAVGGRVMGREADHDIEHDDKRIEAKLALRSSQNGGKTFRYQWASFREADGWTHAWLVTVDYETVRGFLIPRARVALKRMKESKQAYWVGNNAEHDTSKPPGWLAEHEVRLNDAAVNDATVREA